MGKRLGYAHVSTDDQRLDLQRDALNDVRNNKSLAHDNLILNYEESLLIFNHVAALIRFIKALETKIKAQTKAAEQQASRFPWQTSRSNN